MRLLALAATLAALAIAPSTAGAAIVHANGGSLARGYFLAWEVDYDTVAQTITVDAEQTLAGQPVNDAPVRAVVTLTAPSGAFRRFNLGPTTATLDDGTTVDPLIAKSDGLPGILNKGSQTYAVPQGLRVSANRAAAIDFGTDYLPPGFTG